MKMDKIREEYLTDPSRARSLRKPDLILLVKELQLELRKKRSSEHETTNEDKIKLYAAKHRIKRLKEKNSFLRRRIKELKKCDKRNCPTVLLWRNRLKTARLDEKTA